MYGKIEKSNKRKITLTVFHFVAVLISAWILFGSGQEFVFSIFGNSKLNSTLLSRVVIFGCGVFYFIRICITSFVLLKRQMPWNEVLEVGPFVAFIQIFFAILTVYYKEEFNSFDWVLILLFLIGSYINTVSEWKRMIWKKDSANKGKLYTNGLFRYSLHINYFGDSILFTAFALLTGSLWGLTIPVVMTLGFIFVHIPKLDKYLNERYKEQFELYSKSTKKFIPWIY